MSITLAIQAREGSLRFPAKWKAEIKGIYSIDYVIGAVKQSAYYKDNIAFIIPEQDKELIEHIKDQGIKIINDKDRDVYQGFIDIGKGIICRITGDSPCIDAERIDEVIEKIKEGYDYATNEITTFGNCCEAFTWEALNKFKPEQDGDKEHVTLALRRNSTNKWIKSLMLDYPESLEWIREWLK